MRCPACNSRDSAPLTDRDDDSPACADGRCALRCSTCGEVFIARDPKVVARRLRVLRIVSLGTTAFGGAFDLIWNYLLPWITDHKNPKVGRLSVHAIMLMSLVLSVHMLLKSVEGSMRARSLEARNDLAFMAVFFGLWAAAVVWGGIAMFHQGRL